jgi:hypothetical protein
MPVNRPPEGARPRAERVFVVRTWRDAGSAPGSAIRGSVLEVASGQRFVFSKLVDLTDFLILRLAGDGPQA